MGVARGSGGAVRGFQIVTMELPYDQDWLPYPDLGIVALAPHLDAAGRERALDELQAEWRRALRTPVPEAA